MSSTNSKHFLSIIVLFNHCLLLSFHLCFGSALYKKSDLHKTSYSSVANTNPWLTVNLHELKHERRLKLKFIHLPKTF